MNRSGSAKQFLITDFSLGMLPPTTYQVPDETFLAVAMSGPLAAIFDKGMAA